MNLISLLFWALVLVTALVSLRWGAMIGLVVFVLALLFGSVEIARLSPDRGAATVQGFGRAAVANEARAADVPGVARQP